MGMALSDLVIESILRDGFQYVRNNPAILSDVFSNLLSMPKFGQRELNRIIQLVTTTEVSIVQSFANVSDNLPAISIQLLSDVEDVGKVALDDHLTEENIPFDPPYQTPTIYLSNVDATAYNPISGLLTLDPSTVLTNILPGPNFIDASGTAFKILGVVDQSGNKQLLISASLNPGPEIGVGYIQSSITFNEFEVRMNIDREQILLGIHTVDRLTTIYLYNLVKYFILSRKLDLMTRGIVNPTFEGSDFSRAEQYNQPVFSRFITVTSPTENTWQSTQIVPIESLEVVEEVQQDVANNEELGLEGTSINVTENE
jgi:hypothetical protein